MIKKASKRYKNLYKSNFDKKLQSIEDAIQKVKKNCTAKFDESIDVSFMINIKQKKKK